MTTLSTHDTKRSEDVRARLAVLPELGERWYGTAGRAAATRRPIANRAFGYLLWQTFVGAGFDRTGPDARLRREGDARGGRGHRLARPGRRLRGRRCTRRWTAPTTTRRCRPTARRPHRPRSTPYGWSNSLAQKLLQLTMPGVPDVYQGTELFDYSLVDPDNRRPVDFDAAPASCSAERASRPPALDETGAAKLWLVRQALTVRRDRPELFTGYQPLPATGPAAEHLVAFDRGGAITVATRLPVTLHRSGGWRDTELDAAGRRSYRDVLTGQQLRRPAAGWPSCCRSYPVALLTPA